MLASNTERVSTAAIEKVFGFFSTARTILYFHTVHSFCYDEILRLSIAFV